MVTQGSKRPASGQPLELKQEAWLNSRNAIISVPIVVGLIGCTSSSPSADIQSQLFAGRITNVIDGDTFRLADQSKRIRLFGIDAPEKGAVGFDRSSRALRQLAGDQKIRCQIVNTDRYGRTVARCWNLSGKELSSQMIVLGAATEWCRYSKGIYGTCQQSKLEERE